MAAAKMKEMADQQAQPLLEQLKNSPKDAGTLTRVGNLYYDAQAFREAIDYYNRALTIRPNDTDVRTDLGTAYWYQGDTEHALQELQAVLKIAPTKENALFNLGVVQWRGKLDAASAIASWKKLLAANPRYEKRAEVERMIQEAGKHAGMQSGGKM